MKPISSIVMRLAFMTEIVLFSFFYVYGTHGVLAVATLKEEHEKIVQATEKTEKEIELLEKEIDCWQTNSFWKEKIARERLGYARSDELIYYLSES